MLTSPQAQHAPSAVPPPPSSECLERAMQDVLSLESAFVAKFLPYQAMTRVPPGYAEFARWHFRRLHDDSLAWRDVAPAYALACLSHAAYGTAMDPSLEWELELQWSDLRSLSRLDWSSARRLIMDAWTFLSGDKLMPEGLDEAIAAHTAAAGDADAYVEEDEDSLRVDLELVPAYVVLRESMAGKRPEEWRTRGQARWVSGDSPVLSLAMSPALAVLDAVSLYSFVDEEDRLLLRLAFPPNLLRTLDTGTKTRRALDRDLRERIERWREEQHSALLRVPSALCPGEFNLLANPAHPDFGLLQRMDALPLDMDRRRRSH
ncbi:MAG TPA: RES family NAD+ phosphorylase [Arenimonas sp.]|uniref:RES family NAD+ phosphorylase n=1 Tax=Arenimonas sp. TaxID=1872635 RepID=UPI002D80D3BE|nr:RES family NAD+ phosphorylase [Arenimonas sp.]HEU0152228.1 RES family NAD+ phosphorylase [Arenimonas sp.]